MKFRNNFQELSFPKQCDPAVSALHPNTIILYNRHYAAHFLYRFMRPHLQKSREVVWDDCFRSRMKCSNGARFVDDKLSNLSRSYSRWSLEWKFYVPTPAGYCYASPSPRILSIFKRSGRSLKCISFYNGLSLRLRRTESSILLYSKLILISLRLSKIPRHLFTSTVKKRSNKLTTQ